MVQHNMYFFIRGDALAGICAALNTVLTTNRCMNELAFCITHTNRNITIGMFVRQYAVFVPAAIQIYMERSVLQLVASVALGFFFHFFFSFCSAFVSRLLFFFFFFSHSCRQIRKLYLVTIVAYFPSGSMIQIVLSIIVSVIAFAYHVYAQPFKDRYLNVLQGVCLFMTYLAYQAGLMVLSTTPDVFTGDTVLTAVSIAKYVDANLRVCSCVFWLLLLSLPSLPSSSSSSLLLLLLLTLLLSLMISCCRCGCCAGGCGCGCRRCLICWCWC